MDFEMKGNVLELSADVAESVRAYIKAVAG